DGASQTLKGEADEKRQARLESLGVRFLRFTEVQVRHDLDDVVSAIDLWIETNARLG
ncbi:MAG: hypothetical protein QG602_931, partial [Verrucomicrobiota bacterium]|nr:hypothetical protein [Verrucomicrobiota bacterium]